MHCQSAPGSQALSEGQWLSTPAASLRPNAGVRLDLELANDAVYLFRSVVFECTEHQRTTQVKTEDFSFLVFQNVSRANTFNVSGTPRIVTQLCLRKFYQHI